MEGAFEPRSAGVPAGGAVSFWNRDTACTTRRKTYRLRQEVAHSIAELSLLNGLPFTRGARVTNGSQGDPLARLVPVRPASEALGAAWRLRRLKVASSRRVQKNSHRSRLSAPIP